MLDAERPWRTQPTTGVGPLIGLRLWIGSGIWRIGPAWAVLAGALTSGAALLADATPLRLIGAALLADSVWGVLWRMTALAPGVQDESTAETIGLPYYRQTSPAGRFLRLLRRISGGAGWPELFASLVAALILGLLLGAPALILTVAAWAVTLWGWLLIQAGRRPAACDAMLNVGLPWLLGWAITTPAILDVVAQLLDGAYEPLRSMNAPSGLLLGLAFVIQEWGIRRTSLSQGRRLTGLWAGQAAVPVALIGLHQTPTVIVAAALLLPGAWLFWRAGRGQVALAVALSRSGPWRLAAMLTAAILLMR